ncbi:MAG: AAA family ATPase, partial [Proteobacteria bacterium]|nr:AAA family ATPase [Pseudomonadota bacterium]
MQPEFPPAHPLMPPIYAAAELLTAALPPREAIVEPILAREGLAMLYGPRGLGKTFVALGLAWAAAAGGRFLRWQASRPHRVLYVDSEMPAADMSRRLDMLGSAPPGLSFMMASLSPAGLLDLGKPDGQRGFERCWGPHPPELLVLDNLSSLVGLRSGDPDSWNTLQAWLLGLRRRGMAVLLVHHAGKDGTQRGTSRREDVLDLVLALRRPADYAPDQGARFELHFEKARGLHGEAVAPFEARLVTDGTGLAR